MNGAFPPAPQQSNDSAGDRIEVAAAADVAATPTGACTREGESNRLLSLAEQLCKIGHWRTDASGLVQSSAGFELVFGRRPVPGRFSLDDHCVILHPDDVAPTRRKIDDLNAGLTDAYENKARLIRPDGETRVIVSRARAERDPDGGVTSVFGVCMDVTEAARVEEQLRAQSAILASTLDNMDEGLVVIDAEGRLALVNRRGIELLGLPAAWASEAPTLVAAAAQLERRTGSTMLRTVLQSGVLGGEPGRRHRWEETQPNGTVLNLRTVRIADGSLILTCADVTAQTLAEQALRDNEKHDRVVAQMLSDVVMRRTVLGVTTYASPATLDLFGYPPEVFTGLAFQSLVHPEDLDGFSTFVTEIRSGRVDQCSHTFRMKHRDGRWIWIESRARLVRDARGVPVESVSTLRDVTERVDVDVRLRENERRLALALDSGGHGLWDWNYRTGIVRRSGDFWNVFPTSLHDVNSYDDLFDGTAHPEDKEKVRLELEDHVAGRTSLYASEFRLLTKSGAYIWALVRGKAVARDAEGRPLRLIGTMLDISALKESEARITYMARHDALTDLPNRVAFRDRVSCGLEAVSRRDGTLAILFLDLDRFKVVNDTLGHAAGDAVLAEVGRRLLRTVGVDDVVGRLGGDEFAVLSEASGPIVTERLNALAERLIAAVNQPIMLDHRSISVGLTIGIAIAPSDGADVDTLFLRGDLALYRAKADARNTHRFFEARMDDAQAERLHLELDLRDAMARQELELFYQPVLDTGRGRFSGFEALLRWRHPARGLVSPAGFIPMAEESGLIVSIGAWVLLTACRAAMAWGGRSLKVSVNVSAVQFRHDGLLDAITAALADSGLPAGRLEIEITESVLIGNDDAVLALLQQIRALGIRIALDDFGTGFSSLSYLHRFPFDRVKIDRSFVNDIANARTAAIVRTTVDLADRLGMKVTAEGIETADQLRLVLAEGCIEVQGYLVSRPVCAADAMTLAQRKQGGGRNLKGRGSATLGASAS